MKRKIRQLEKSVRENYRVVSRTADEWLPEMFETLFVNQLEPQFKKMVEEGVFKPVHGFARYDTGFNEFYLDIDGDFLPEGNIDLVVNEEMPDQTAENFAANLRSLNGTLIGICLKEMKRQNILGGAGRPFGAEGLIGVLEYGYTFHIVWRCLPSGAQGSRENVNPLARNAVNN